MPAKSSSPALSCLVTLVALTGCAGWQAVRVAPASFSPPPARMRVTRADGWQAVLASPRLENDTLRGMRAEEPYDSIVMPASQIRSVAVPMREERDALTRAGAFAGFLMVFAGIMYFGYRASGS